MMYQLVELLLQFQRCVLKETKVLILKNQNILINEIEYFFGEDQGRYIIEVS